MIKRTITALGVTALLSPLALAAPAEAATAGQGGTTSLAEVLAADGNRFDRNWDDFDVVDRAVRTVLSAKPDSPVAVLAQGEERLTAFVPTDRGFRRLVNSVAGTRPASEKATFRAVAKVADVDTIETILLYHVVPGATILSEQAAASDGAELTTAQGGTVTVRVGEQRIRLVDQDPDHLNPPLVAGLLDINESNRQVAHGIARVLRPVDL